MAYILRDTFSEAADVLLSSHAPEVGDTWSNTSWSTQTITVKGGLGYAIGASTSSTAAWVNSTEVTGDTEASIEFVLSSGTNNSVGILAYAKSDGSRELYNIYLSNGNFSIEKWVGGSLSSTIVNSVPHGLSLVDPHTARFVFSDGTITTYLDGSTTAFNAVTDPTPLPTSGRFGIGSRTNGRVLTLSVGTELSATTPPTLTSATATATGQTTASGSVTTDEGNGNLYSVATASATVPSQAQVKSGQDHTGSAAGWSASQAISSTGAKSVSVTGLTASTTYYLHHMHEDAASNQSDVVSSASFTTAGAFASTISVTEALKNNTGTLLASQSGIKVAVLASADLASVYEGTATTNASGLLSDITNAAIVAGSYHVAIKLTDGSVGITGAIEAV